MNQLAYLVVRGKQANVGVGFRQHNPAEDVSWSGSTTTSAYTLKLIDSRGSQDFFFLVIF